VRRASTRRATTRRASALGALAALGGAVAACVEIAAGPEGVASIRLEPLPLPPSIVIGDTLRDSTGAVLRLRATAFNANGDTVAGAPFRFLFVPISRDTALSDNRAVVVDSLTGLVRAAGPAFVVPQARVGVRLGDRLQLLDTLEIVPRPKRLLRAATNGDSLRTLAFFCPEAATVPPGSTVPDTGAARRSGIASGTPVGNVATLATLLVGDSATRDSVPVRSYLVRYEIVSPTTIPTVPLERGTRPAIGIVDGGADNMIRFDTTNSGGAAEPRLRLFAPGLTRAAFPRDTIPVTVRATAIRSRTDTVGSVLFTVRVVRITRSPSTGDPISCP
jgi:hypothetical protein